jgi:hypothetical protein
MLGSTLRAAEKAASRLRTELGSARTTAGDSESDGSGGTN